MPQANLFIATFANPDVYPVELHLEQCLYLLRRLRAVGKQDEWMEETAAARMVELRKYKLKQMKKDRMHELKRTKKCHDFADIREEDLKAKCEELREIRGVAEAEARKVGKKHCEIM